MDYSTKKRKKFDFCAKKKCAIKSLKQVNCFLNNFSKVYSIKKLINKY